MYATAGIPGLSKDAVTALPTHKSHNGITTTYNRLHAILLGLFSKKIDEKLDPVEFKSHPLPKIEEGLLSPLHVTKIRKAVLDIGDVTVAVGKIVEKKTKRAVDYNREGKIIAAKSLRARTVEVHSLHSQATELRQTTKLNQETRRHSLPCQKNKPPSYHHGNM